VVEFRGRKARTMLDLVGRQKVTPDTLWIDRDGNLVADRDLRRPRLAAEVAPLPPAGAGLFSQEAK
jgi:hypothetical protein